MNCKIMVVMCAAITSLISAEPLMSITGDELIDSALNDF